MKEYIVFVVFSQFLILIQGQGRVVTIAQGQVRGYRHPDRPVYQFLGIPYATAPTGREKFKAPLPAPTWNTTLEATNFLVICPQHEFLIGPLPYTEDCLVVNVFVPDNESTSKPVLVIIHGGGFAYGFGNMAIPYNLIERNIVTVTFNYRVGVHGLLCLNTENAPGNVGLKDQIAAIQWIKNNIQAFGGDPNDITLSGYSAGAVSAELLMLTPIANGLFDKVILESGSAMMTLAVNPKGLERAREVALRNGATDVDTVHQLEQYYLSLSYPELVALLPGGLEFGFLPCIENDDRDDSVITTMPQETLESGKYTKLPLLTGYTDAEGLIVYEEREYRIAEMNVNFASQLPPNIDSYSALSEQEVIELIRSFYFDEDVITTNSLRNFTDYFTDSLFAYGIIESARLHATNDASAYLYEFSYVLSTDELRETGLGAKHTAQTELILTNVETGPNGTHTETDLTVQRRLLDMWSNFIITGTPVTPGQPDYWEPVDAERMNYLVIDADLEFRSFPIPERMLLWDRIMKDDAHSLTINLSLLILTSVLLIR